MRTTVLADWIAMIDTLRANGIQPVVMLTPRPEHKPEHYTYFYQFQNELVDYANKTSFNNKPIPVVDMRDTKLASDKVHPQDYTAMYSDFQNRSGLA